MFIKKTISKCIYVFVIYILKSTTIKNGTELSVRGTPEIFCTLIFLIKITIEYISTVNNILNTQNPYPEVPTHKTKTPNLRLFASLLYQTCQYMTALSRYKIHTTLGIHRVTLIGAADKRHDSSTDLIRVAGKESVNT